MSLSGLFNKKCSWRRLTMTGEGEYGGAIYTEVTISSDVDCRVEKFSMKELLEYKDHADGNFAAFYLYLEGSHDINPNDKVTVFDSGQFALGSDNFEVKDTDDAAGHSHHLEVILEQAKVLPDDSS